MSLVNNKTLILIISAAVIILAGLVIRESDRQVIMAQETIQGYRISQPFSLDGIKDVTDSSIEWKAIIPDETRIFIKTAITTDGENPPEFDDTVWQEYEIEQSEGSISIPGIGPGADFTGLTNPYLWTMQILETDNPATTPQLDWLKETITMAVETEGYRISPEFDISGPETVKDSQIFWQADERFDGNINVKVNVFTEGEWKYEQEVVNGGQIPSLEPGKSLSGAKIQTKTSFVGGPNFYPSLENIKIFIDLEE